MSKITREQIVAAGTAMIAEEGAEAFSMRRLAERLGVTPMALYHHVGNRERLLHAVLHEVSSRLERPELPADPRERALAVALSFHAFLRANPWAIPLISVGRTDAREGIWVSEQLVQAAVDAGVPDEAAFRFFRVVLAVVVGQVVAFPPGGDDAEDVELPPPEPSDEEPGLHRFLRRWSAYDRRLSVQALLRSVIDAQLPAPQRR
ncbi:TetR/AcrR family transcriptional regulator [Herbiconiux sp. YIM B11900]|uniref:TetR/AcrR family transcriptional regulator n=1 Tax=Herbiconiux sp. YIM B11900 TaxID=3404131 RepID=UPI003F82E3AC